jgi:hypothetical protein
MKRMTEAAETAANLDNMNDAIRHIEFTVEHSPKAYALYRQRLISLRQLLVNAEIRHDDLANGRANAQAP